MKNTHITNPEHPKGRQETKQLTRDHCAHDNNVVANTAKILLGTRLRRLMRQNRRDLIGAKIFSTSCTIK